MQKEMRVALLISGGGTTMLEIARSSRGFGATPRLAGLIRVVCVISSRSDAPGIEKARGLGICTEIVDPRDWGDKFGDVLLQTLNRYNVEAFGQHGWMAITPPEVVKEFAGRAINQHPGAVDPGHPGFGGINPGMFGLRVHAATLYYRRATKTGLWTEATAQLVAEEVDEGQLICTSKMQIAPDDTPESLQKRLLPIEHDTQIEAWSRLASGVKPYLREERLIPPAYLRNLQEAKRVAQLLYPKG